ncbi:wax ester/triacylglycerol synthase family O-acyltransferase [Actinomycetospora sp. NBRC 106378]|uniref:wax ester/triacylglycerol synthase family O-acyltransferase n=1 Tax=Actinomycetospora sp. NBRC 106378 TaxID=3032208 RepID=UPI00249FD11E|nr:wax ester/triacylglycerol synthase family O-acyltransferase [Actinomycetospora sp. NBRC 106378]GLZ52994.1 diacylglycerol O-acyltransferase [Actinomycetospora sp. NBRC 106378]
MTEDRGERSDGKQNGLGWADADEMTAFETMMWRAEADPALRSTMVAVADLDATPDWPRLVAAHDWATRMVPRFRKRVVEPPLGLGAPVWSPDPDFDLDRHVRRVSVPSGQGWSGVLAIAEHLALTPFDRDRPPWEAVLVEGLPDGRAAYLLKLHHATTDGLGGVQLFNGLLNRSRETDTDKPQPEVPVVAGPGPWAALGRQVRHDAEALASVPVHMVRAAGAALRDPIAKAREAVAFGLSAIRVIGDPGAAPSPLLATRGPDWRFVSMELPFAPFRAAAKAGGGTVNDAYLAALLGAFRLYHEALGQPTDTIRMSIPVSLRADADSAGGNRIASLRLAGHIAEKDPVARMATIAADVARGRAEPAADDIGLVSPLLARLPGSVMAAVAGGVTKGNDLQASNVPGIREDVFLAGARVDRMFPYAPRPGCAAMITMLTHGDTCCLGANIDPAAITDRELFGRCLVEGFVEVLALGPDAPEPLLRT